MLEYNIFKVIVYLLAFISCMYALEAINFEKFIKKNQIFKARLLYLLIAIALAYLVAEFIINLKIS